MIRKKLIGALRLEVAAATDVKFKALKVRRRRSGTVKALIVLSQIKKIARKQTREVD